MRLHRAMIELARCSAERPHRPRSLAVAAEGRPKREAAFWFRFVCFLFLRWSVGAGVSVGGGAERDCEQTLMGSRCTTTAFGHRTRRRPQRGSAFCRTVLFRSAVRFGWVRCALRRGIAPNQSGVLARPLMHVMHV